MINVSLTTTLFNVVVPVFVAVTVGVVVMVAVGVHVPVAVAARAIRACLGATAKAGVETAAWPLSVARYEQLKDDLPGYQFTDESGLVRTMRLIKSPAEIALQRLAGKAAEAGIDNIDTSISSMSMTYGHSATESLVAILEDTGRSTGLDIRLLEEIAAYFREVRQALLQAIDRERIARYGLRSGALAETVFAEVRERVPGDEDVRFPVDVTDLHVLGGTVRFRSGHHRRCRPYPADTHD